MCNAAMSIVLYVLQCELTEAEAHLLMVQRTKRPPASCSASYRSVATTLDTYTYLHQHKAGHKFELLY
jgi:hypothetical protein